MRNILCYGDSNTWGYNPLNAGRFSWNIRWTSRLDEELKEKGYRVIEEGLCGRTTVFDDPLREGRNGSKMLPVLLETHTPDIVIIMLGTNDCKKHYDASSGMIAKGAEKLINQVQTYGTDIKIILISPIHLGKGVGEYGYDPEFDEFSEKVSRQLKEAYSVVARKYGVTFIAASDFVAPSNADREHMDEEGHRIFADVVSKTVIELNYN